MRTLTSTDTLHSVLCGFHTEHPEVSTHRIDNVPLMFRAEETIRDTTEPIPGRGVRRIGFPR